MAFSAPSTLYRSFERVSMSVWRGFLWESAAIRNPCSHGANDTTFFNRETASRHYQDRSGLHVCTLKNNGAGRYRLMCHPQIFTARHTIRATPKLAVESAFVTPTDRESRRSKGYLDQSLLGALRSGSVRALVRHRLFAAYDYAHNARLDSGL
jgi:IS5 family transposase